MSRLLFFAAIAFAVYWLIKSYRKQVTRDEEAETPIEDMVRCAQCGVHLPKHESVSSEGKYFCSREHQRLFVKEAQHPDE